ncbi:hypothetical protein F5B22DRAFT_644579 [Xylaria bambusicola]|uniref:uncharacterized protein n=1 Tax=Xylaria bambusicola TaxID=326684 RepID=UPI0020077EEE|nr:uncharacterized protein F5B22DRAFT_644579 [Xylaria bambusicola]KAI0520835.1 hypothetical protein F5B22DRAFT_644579 [Xylaria bambusicola]
MILMLPGKSRDLTWRKNTYARISRKREQDALASAIEVRRHQTQEVHHSNKGKASYVKLATDEPRRRRASVPSKHDELDGNTDTAPQCRDRQCKTYKKERTSRRLAGKKPDESPEPLQRKIGKETNENGGRETSKSIKAWASYRRPSKEDGGRNKGLITHYTESGTGRL